VKWFFMGEDALKGSDINVDTVDHVVTLKGTVTWRAARAP
jgi:osmotically-inducible protein OsmY